jgi:hypothetical protein
MKQRDLEQLLIANHALMLHVRDYLRMGMRFLWSLEDCRNHFRQSPEWIKAAAKRWAGYEGRRGADFILTREQVFAIEQGYTDEMREQGDPPPLSIHLHPKPQGAA